MNQSRVITISGPHVTKAMLATLQDYYADLKIEHEDVATIDAEELTDDEFDKVVLDINFYQQNPNLALENLCCHLDNFEPRNTSQEELLSYVNKLLGIEKSNVAAGIWMYGDAGIGKTHIAVAMAKEFMRRDMQAYFRFASDLNNSDLRLAGANQAWVIDDLNSGYSANRTIFTDLVLNTHNKKGRLFVTSNLPYEKFIDQRFPEGVGGNPAARMKYLDRTEECLRFYR